MTRPQDVKAYMRQERWGDRNARAYQAYHRLLSSRAGWRGLMAELLRGLGPGAEVLEVGVGTGFITAILAEAGYRVTGFDLSPAMLERARENLSRQGLADRVKLAEGDAEAINAPEASFDAVVSRWVLWTLPNPETALAEMARVLRPGGLLALVDGRVLAQGRLARWRGNVTDFVLTGRRPGWRKDAYANIDPSLPRLGLERIAERLREGGLETRQIKPDIDAETDGLARWWLMGSGWTSHAVSAVKAS